MSSFKHLLAAQLQDPEVRMGYEDAQRRKRVVVELVQARRSQGLLQREVAERMGVGQSTVAGFEAGENDPRLGTLQRYARAVNRRLDFFVTTPIDSRFCEYSTPEASFGASWSDGGRPVSGTLQASGDSSRADFALAG